MKEKDNKGDVVQYDLRFIDLDRSLKDDLLKEFSKLKGVEVEWSKSKKPDCFTLWIRIDEKTDVRLIKQVISTLGVKDTHYGVWVSFTSYFDNGGVRFPHYVTLLFREIGGYLDFSYVIIYE